MYHRWIFHLRLPARDVTFREISRARRALSGAALVCGPVLGLLMNYSELSRLTIRREAWRKDR